MKNKALFLDRDGVINQAIIRNNKGYAPGSVEELRLVDGILEVTQYFKKRGFLIIGVTNQPDVVRGKFPLESVLSINKKLMELVPLDEIFVCFHDDKDACECRKPRPGLLTDAAKKYDIDCTKSIIIGDRWKDVAAGLACGCQTVFLDYEYDEKYEGPRAHLTIKNLQELLQSMSVFENILEIA